MIDQEMINQLDDCRATVVKSAHSALQLVRQSLENCFNAANTTRVRSSTSMLIRKAWVAHSCGDFAKAAELFEQASDSKSPNVNAMLSAANMYGKSGQLLRAISLYKQVLEMNNTNDKQRLMAQQKVADAASKQQFLGDQAKALHQEGMRLNKSGQTTLALQKFERASQLNHNLVIATLSAANMNMKLGRWVRARELYARAEADAHDERHREYAVHGAARADEQAAAANRAAAEQAGTQLYHQTSSTKADIILRTQTMRPGSRGLAGGGIYFTTTKELTGHKAQVRGVVLKATVRLGKILTLQANGDRSMTLQKLRGMGFDSVNIAREVSSGHEYVVYDPAQVLKIELA